LDSGEKMAEKEGGNMFKQQVVLEEGRLDVLYALQSHQSKQVYDLTSHLI
jgi:hypothetical protein